MHNTGQPNSPPASRFPAPAMPNPLPPSDDFPQPHQGLGARLVRGLGGAVRSGIARLRRHASLPSSPIPQPDQDQPSPAAPTRPRAPHRPATAPAAPSPQTNASGCEPGQAPPSHQPAAPTGDPPFTPEKFPTLSPKACAILNTPAEGCDPEFVQLVLFVLAGIRAETPEMSVTEARALFAELWERLGGPIPGTSAAAEQHRPPDAAPAAAPDSAPDAAPQAAPVAAQATRPAAPNASSVTPHDLPAAPDAPTAPEAASRPDPTKTPAMAEPAIGSGSATPPRPGICRHRALRLDLRRRIRPRPLIRRSPPVRRAFGRQRTPPLHAGYAARASPR